MDAALAEEWRRCEANEMEMRPGENTDEYIARLRRDVYPKRRGEAENREAEEAMEAQRCVAQLKAQGREAPS
eukprot:Skav203978  [mRNA]  locus=scaffold94:729554:731574:- [translate_table: standard]